MLSDSSLPPAPSRDARVDTTTAPATVSRTTDDQRLLVRRALLEVCVLDDVDLVPTADGLCVSGPAGEHELSAQAATAIVGDRAAADPDTRPRLRNWLRAHAAVTPQALTTYLRPLALAPGSALHPGPEWVRQQVPGGALDLGFGLVGAVPGSDAPTPLWPDLLARLNDEAVAAGGRPLDLDAAWRSALARLEGAGRTAARRAERSLRAQALDHELLGDAERGSAHAVTVFEPVFGCDALTLLASAPLRRWLADADGTGLRVVAVPSRRTGWTDLGHTEAAFVTAAWAASEPDQRGLARPVLVTRDEVALVPRWVS
ncbi:hypothetical protein SAMN06264364_12651 [Quadrisphaera granulorum]|uniref:Uncharacterized protein n=1 Tax=Quadrisphaera granulorum TaxID=317664 RepID=A0A315ZWQ4_9ACTN|nr:hypothetical protein [Quadrisphaera granulorum]PWJ49298.1 hypothetical protein BXY45_12651 [Quadrisphaera granulorum]SZE98215.1 hypothetical protein SAMN06264364_12651 [Quadrisphaera granulorum]